MYSLSNEPPYKLFHWSKGESNESTVVEVKQVTRYETSGWG